MDGERRVILVEMDEREAEICAMALGVYTGVASSERALQAGDLLDRVEAAIQIETQPGGRLYSLGPIETPVRKIGGGAW